MKRKVHDQLKFIDYCTFFGICFLAIMGLGNLYFCNINKRNVTVTINNKERNTKIFGSKELIVFTDKGIYRNTNSIIQGKYNEKSVYFALETKTTCTLTIIGEHTFIFHTTPNILEVKECK